MNESASPVSSPIQPRALQALYAAEATPEVAMIEERLPFTVRLVRTEDDLRRAINMRYEAYARHMPEFAEKLKQPEQDDFERDSIIMLAESKLDGSVIGTMRIQSNAYRPLSMEHAIALPDWLRPQSMVEVRRLGVANGQAGRLVKMVLIKACLLYCAENNIKWAVVAARPPLDRSYEKLLFIDVLPGQTFTPLPTAHNTPHKIMAFEIETCEARFTEHRHPLLNFFCKINHSDICVDTDTELAAIMLNLKSQQQFATN
jgi:hypothetical protein